MFDPVSGLSPSVLEAIIAVLVVAGLVQFATIAHLGRRIDVLKEAVLTQTRLALVAAFEGFDTELANIRLTLKARRANIRANRAEQRAAHFRRKFRSASASASASPVLTPAFDALFHRILGSKRQAPARSPFPTFAEFLESEVAGKRDRDPFAALASRLRSPVADHARSAASPFASGGYVPGRSDPDSPFVALARALARRSAPRPADNPFSPDALTRLLSQPVEHTSTVELPNGKSLTVSDIERALGLPPGSATVVEMTPDGPRELRGEDDAGSLVHSGPVPLVADNGDDGDGGTLLHGEPSERQTPDPRELHGKTAGLDGRGHAARDHLLADIAADDGPDGDGKRNDPRELRGDEAGLGERRVPRYPNGSPRAG